MGYYVTVNSDNFLFRYGKEKEIMTSIKEAIKNKQIFEENWIDFTMILKSETLEEIFNEFRFELSLIIKKKYIRLSSIVRNLVDMKKVFLKLLLLIQMMDI